MILHHTEKLYAYTCRLGRLREEWYQTSSEKVISTLWNSSEISTGWFACRRGPGEVVGIQKTTATSEQQHVMGLIRWQYVSKHSEDATKGTTHTECYASNCRPLQALCSLCISLYTLPVSSSFYLYKVGGQNETVQATASRCTMGQCMWPRGTGGDSMLQECAFSCAILCFLSIPLRKAYQKPLISCKRLIYLIRKQPSQKRNAPASFDKNNLFHFS